jgi:nucleotide-binding universal stress UspA family protein
MIKRILVPTDFSKQSRAAIKYGLDLAKMVSGEVILLHVVEEEPVCNYMVGPRSLFHRDEFALDVALSRSPLPQRIIRRDLCEEAYWKLATLFPPASRKRVHMVVTVGKPAREIVRVAREQDADLIMLGSGGRRGLRRFLRKSVIDKVRRKASIPVIAVDAHDRGREEAPERSGAPYQGVEGGQTDFQGDEQGLTEKDMAHSWCHPDASTTSLPKGVDRSAEDPVVPPRAPFKPRAGQHGTGGRGRSTVHG